MRRSPRPPGRMEGSNYKASSCSCQKHETPWGFARGAWIYVPHDTFILYPNTFFCQFQVKFMIFFHISLVKIIDFAQFFIVTSKSVPIQGEYRSPQKAVFLQKTGLQQAAGRVLYVKKRNQIIFRSV